MKDPTDHASRIFEHQASAGEMAVPFVIVHVSPGRLRVRVRRLRGDLFFSEALKWLLRSQQGVDEVRVNADCASLVINFEPNRFNPVQYLRGITETDLLTAEIPLEDKARKRLKKNSLYRAVQNLDVLMPPSVQASLGVLAFGCALAGAPALICRWLLGAATVPVFNRALRILFDEHRLGPDALDGLSCIVLTVRGQFIPASCMVGLIGLGELIREFAARRFEKIMDHLQAMSGVSAWQVEGQKRTRIPLHEIPAGASLVVYTGETIPVDGIVTEGGGIVATHACQRQVSPGSYVEDDSVLLEGKIYIEQAGRPSVKPTGLEQRKRRRDLYRTRYQTVSLTRAYRVFAPVLAWAGLGFLLNRNVGHALTLICFDLVTGVRIAVPSVVLESMYRAGRKGILIKNGLALERLAEVDTVIFATSGTVTAGFADVTEVIPLAQVSVADIIRQAAAAEHRYYHPAARAIWRQARKAALSVPERSGSLLIGGLGIIAEVDGRSVGVGSKRFMQMEGVDISNAEHPEFYVQSRGDSLAYVSIDGELAGVIAYRDPVRSNVPQVVKQLSKLGINDIVLASGDSIQATRKIASESGVSKFVAELTPGEKADLVRDYQLKGRCVAMVGDDVSDELALSQADLAVSMKESADVARYESHIVLMDDDLRQLPESIQIAKKAMNVAHDNVLLVSLPNILGLVLSLFNKIGPVHGALLNNGSVIIVSLLGLGRSATGEEHLEI